jgi:predicted MPP superfamily phosphohydrolase
LKTLIVQLSDIHFRNEYDPLINKTDSLVSAISSEIINETFIVLTFTGDIAFSGDVIQYVIAADWIKTLKNKLRNSNKYIKDIELVFIPGNHDCDFSQPQGTRNILIKSLSSEPLTKDIIDNCTSVQNNFFEFVKEMTSEDITGLNRVFYSKTIKVKNVNFVFNCINTAWVSQLKEQHGNLFFPNELLKSSAEREDISITIFHHPYNWLKENINRDFRKVIEENSDILLSGHEHDSISKKVTSIYGEITEYFEGGALQDSYDPENSSFNLLFIDPENHCQKLIIYKWKSNIYNTIYRSQQWEEFFGNKLRKKREFEVSKSQLEWLTNPGINITHPVKGVLKLDDIFIYPDLRESGYSKGEINTYISGEKLFDQIISFENIFITAPEQAGKTSLCKTLYKDFIVKGYVPLLIQGQELKAKNNEQIIDFIVLKAEEQYEGDISDKFKQLDRVRKVIIIDSFHKLKISKGYENDFLSLLESYFGKIVLLSNDIAQQINEITEAKRLIEERVSFRTFRIMTLGYVRRNDLIEKWLLLDPTLLENEELLISKITAIAKVIDTIIGKNFVPAYPIIILSVLQNNESITSIDVSASTYGYFYELFIRNALALGSSKTQFDIKIAYLSFFAYKIFSLQRAELTEDEFENLHKEYEAEYDLKISYDNIKLELEKCLILIKIGDTYEFKYKYMYYYFVAKYFNDFITSDLIRKEISTISNALYIEDNANILLFLAHLSKDPFIINEMTTAAKKYFRDVPVATLVNDLDFLKFDDLDSSMIEKNLEIEYVEKKIIDARKEHLAELDNIENNSEIENNTNDDQIDDNFEEMSSYVKELGGAFKTLQILGQILKNFPGSLPASKKLEIANECYNLGLRSLGNMLLHLSENRDDLVRYVIDLHRSADAVDTRKIKYKNYSSENELLEKAKHSILSLTQAAIYSTVKRISSSVGSPSLSETYNKLINQTNTCAMQLIHGSLLLEHSSSFPESKVIGIGKNLKDNLLPLSIYKHLVVNHFQLFHVEYQSKQRVCDGVGISYKRLQNSNPKLRLTSKK